MLKTTLNLDLAAEKTLIPHALTSRAKFLGYEIGTMRSQTKLDNTRRRVISGKVGLYIPDNVIQTKRKRDLRDGKVIHRTELMNDSEFAIIVRYQGEYRGLMNYYSMAYNLNARGYLRYTMETSLRKTLAGKNKTTVGKTLKRLQTVIKTPRGPRPG